MMGSPWVSGGWKNKKGKKGKNGPPAPLTGREKQEGHHITEDKGINPHITGKKGNRRGRPNSFAYLRREHKKKRKAAIPEGRGRKQVGSLKKWSDEKGARIAGRKKKPSSNRKERGGGLGKN